jgi:hypothetical protein
MSENVAVSNGVSFYFAVSLVGQNIMLYMALSQFIESRHKKTNYILGLNTSTVINDAYKTNICGYDPVCTITGYCQAFFSTI